jgi:hypothetical protein
MFFRSKTVKKSDYFRGFRVVMLLEHLQPFEAPGPKSDIIFARIGCKMGVGGIIFPVGTPAFDHQRRYSFKIASSRYTKASLTRFNPGNAHA